MSPTRPDELGELHAVIKVLIITLCYAVCISVRGLVAPVNVTGLFSDRMRYASEVNCTSAIQCSLQQGQLLWRKRCHASVELLVKLT